MSHSAVYGTLISLCFISGHLQARDDDDCTQHNNTAKSTPQVAVSGTYFIIVFITSALDLALVPGLPHFLFSKVLTPTQLTA